MHSKTWPALANAFWLGGCSTSGPAEQVDDSTRHVFPRRGQAVSRRCLASLPLIWMASGHPAIADDDWSTGAGRYVWMRKDGQRITGNARLEKQISEDKQTCLEFLKESASIVPENNGSSMVRGCLAAKDYVLIPAAEMEQRLEDAAATGVKRQALHEKSGAMAQRRKQDNSDPNKTNRQIMAMSEKDRRAFFATAILSDARLCGDVTRAFYRGSARPSRPIHSD
jgi:hypothetical protein